MNDKKLANRIIGKNIRYYREKQLKTIAELATITSLDDKHLGNIERGEKLPSSFTLIKIAHALNIPLTELAVGVDDAFELVLDENSKR